MESSYNPNGVPRDQLAHALGIYLMSWLIFTTILLIASLRTSIALIALFTLLDVTFMLQIVASFTGSVGVKTASGVAGLVTSLIAWYVGTAELLTHETSCFTLPVVELQK